MMKKNPLTKLMDLLDRSDSTIDDKSLIYVEQYRQRINIVLGLFSSPGIIVFIVCLLISQIFDFMLFTTIFFTFIIVAFYYRTLITTLSYNYEEIFLYKQLKKIKIFLRSL